MKNSPLKKPFLLSAVLTAAALVFRFILQFVMIDHKTGFYAAGTAGNVLQIVFNVFLLVCILLIWFSVRGTAAEFSTRSKQFSREFFIGLIFMGFAAELSYLYAFLTEVRGFLDGHGLYLPSAIPAFIFVLGGILLLYQGLLGLSGKQDRIDLLSASILSLWGAAALVCTYLSHSIVYHVSDNMLHVLAVAALAFFLTNVLKYMMGVQPEISGRRAVHYALFTGFFGLTLVIPRLVVMLVYGGHESLGAPRFYDLIFVLVSTVVALMAAHTIAFGKEAPLPEEPAEAKESAEIPADEVISENGADE